MAFKVELKKIHVDSRMSEETNCYSAELHVNGKKVGIVSNHGTGGCDDVRLLDNCGWTEKELNEQCKIHCKEYSFVSEYSKNDDGTPFVHEADLELVCGAIIDRHLTLKAHRRAMNSKVLVLGDKKGEVRQFSWKGVKKIDHRHIESVLKSHPEFAGKILNLVSDDDKLWEMCK